MKERNYILAFETGIGGGSISIFDGRKLLGFRVNDSDKSKTDFLIGQIANLLTALDISKNELKDIYFSGNPGSQTALKIGIAAAKGISTALGANLHRIDLFQSIARYFKNHTSTNISIILPVSKTEFECRLFFTEKSITSNEITSVSLGLLKSADFLDIEIFKKKIHEMCQAHDTKAPELFIPFQVLPEDTYQNFKTPTPIKNINELGKNLSKYLIY